MPFVERDGVRIAYDLVGDGPPLVWVPGTGVGGAVWTKAQVPHFRDRYKCLTIDLRGAGRSDAPEGPYAVTQLADDVAAVVEAVLGGQPAHFVGWSLGAAAIQELALSRPHVVSSAVLIATWSSTSREHHIRRWFEARLLALRHAPIEVFRAFAFWMWAPTVVDLEPDRMTDIEEFFRSISYSLPVHAYVAHFEADLAHETYERLPSISCPTLVLCGDEDLITLPRYNQTVASRIPRARLVVIPRAGHFVMLERPNEVNAAIDQFLQELQSPPITDATKGS